MRAKLTALLSVLLLALGASACNTVEGIQQDAEELQQEAEDALDDMGDDDS